jgi:predicted phage terminase large subunit-like protein
MEKGIDLSHYTIDEITLASSICRDDFYFFVQEFWHTVIPETPIWNWHIKYLCKQLQAVAERVFRWEPKAYDLIINVPPGSTKSTLASVLFPAWCWTRMPTSRCIGGSHAHPLAMDLSLKNRDVVLSEKYRAYFPELSLRRDQQAKSHFKNTHGGTRYAVGVGGSVTGMHGHFLLVDDPLDPEKAVSEAELKTANRWMTSTLPTRKVDKLVVPTILIMQRLHQNDCTGHLLDIEDLKVRHICIPAERNAMIKPKYLRRFYKNGLFDNERCGPEVLKEQRAVLGEYGYAGQFLQNPVPLAGGMFKTDRLTIDTPPVKMADTVRYWDKAGTKESTGTNPAYTAGVKMSKDLNGRFWVMDVKRVRLEAFAREKLIKQTAQMDGKDVQIVIEQEPGSGGKESAHNTVRNLAGFKVRIDKVSGDKSQRADPFATQVNGENVYIKPGPWNKVYIEEHQYFPNSTYKDQVDAGSGAFAFLTFKRKRGVF